jgi:folate-binding protein YgfZ
MTQTEPAPTIALAPTALAASLDWAQKSPALGGYRGALTAVELDAPGKETAALAAGVAVHDLGWLRRVAVRGEDRFRWLSGMVTNTVNDLPENGGAWNLVLTAQGRIQGDLWVWRDGDALELEIAADQYDKLLAHLDRFIIMDDVELAPIEDLSAFGLTGPKAAEALSRAGLPALNEALTQCKATWNGIEVRIRRSYGALAPHYEIWVPANMIASLWNALADAGAMPVGFASLEAFRIAEGIPAYGTDIVERDLPQETSQVRALNFNKGCYLGQEIVERIRSRGNVHRHLRQLELTGPVPAAGTEFNSAESGKPAGHITSAAELQLPAGRRIVALAMVRAEAEVGEAAFTYSAGTETGHAKILSGAPELHL